MTAAGYQIKKVSIFALQTKKIFKWTTALRVYLFINHDIER